MRPLAGSVQKAARGATGSPRKIAAKMCLIVVAKPEGKRRKTFPRIQQQGPYGLLKPAQATHLAGRNAGCLQAASLKLPATQPAELCQTINAQHPRMSIQQGLRLLDQQVTGMRGQLPGKKGFDQGHALPDRFKRMEPLLKHQARHAPQCLQRQTRIKQFAHRHPDKAGKHANAKAHRQKIQVADLAQINTPLTQADQFRRRGKRHTITAVRLGTKMEIQLGPGSRQQFWQMDHFICLGLPAPDARDVGAKPGPRQVLENPHRGKHTPGTAGGIRPRLTRKASHLIPSHPEHVVQGGEGEGEAGGDAGKNIEDNMLAGGDGGPQDGQAEEGTGSAQPAGGIN